MWRLLSEARKGLQEFLSHNHVREWRDANGGFDVRFLSRRRDILEKVAHIRIGIVEQIEGQIATGTPVSKNLLTPEFYEPKRASGKRRR